jgi:hypothetical protein
MTAPWQRQRAAALGTCKDAFPNALCTVTTTVTATATAPMMSTTRLSVRPLRRRRTAFARCISNLEEDSATKIGRFGFRAETAGSDQPTDRPANP